MYDVGWRPCHVTSLCVPRHLRGEVGRAGGGVVWGLVGVDVGLVIIAGDCGGNVVDWKKVVFIYYNWMNFFFFFLNIIFSFFSFCYHFLHLNPIHNPKISFLLQVRIDYFI